MKNPWTKKNPFLSMWLSGANAMMGSARGVANAQAKRQAVTLMTEGTKEIGKFWSGALAAPPARKTKKPR